MSFGSRLKMLRTSKKMKQQDLAAVLGVTESAINKYETDIITPKATVMIKIFKYFAVDPDYLFQDDISVHESTQISPKENYLVKKYRSLDYYGQRAVEAYIDAQCGQRRPISEIKY